MRQIFECEDCGKIFNNKEDCLKHEKECFKEFPLKVIFFDNEYNLEKEEYEDVEIYVLEYPKCFIRDGLVYFFSGSAEYDLPPTVFQLSLEEIRIDKARYSIFTTDFSEKHEKECIEKLLNERKECFKKDLEILIKRYNKIINGEEKFNITREKDSRYLVREE